MKQKIEQKLENKNIEYRISMTESSMIAKIEASLIEGAREYCRNNDYQLIAIPHLTKATGACENFSTLFSTDLFGNTAYLNQTGQLMLEAFMETYKKVYCDGPSFRKEMKADDRHLIEFPLFEIEVANHNLEELKIEISNIFSNMISKVEKECNKELEHLIDDKSFLNNLKPPYNSITYRDAIQQLAKYDLKFGDDLKSEHELYLVNLNDNKPLFITNYPEEIKFFNMRLNRADNTIVNSMDLIMPYSGESVGAAEREENHVILKKRLNDSSMLKLLEEAIITEKGYEKFTAQEIHVKALERFDWYMDIIKNYPITHAGCGIGINRVTQSILQTKDIRYATAFPMNKETLF
jgi:asparaginyl-tRNA synthetase